MPLDLAAQQRGEGRADRSVEIADDQLRLGGGEPMPLASNQRFSNPWILHGRPLLVKNSYDVDLASAHCKIALADSDTEKTRILIDVLARQFSDAGALIYDGRRVPTSSAGAVAR